MSPVLAGGLLTIGSPGKSCLSLMRTFFFMAFRMILENIPVSRALT